MMLTRSHCSLVIAHFECTCSLTLWSHSVHILEINCCRGFRTCDQSSLWTTNSVSCTFTVELTDTSISWVMLSLLTIHHLFSLPRFLPQFLKVRALGKGYLRGTNQAILYDFILLWFGFHTLESESHQWVLIRKKMLKIIRNIKKKGTHWLMGSLRIYSTNTPWFLVVWLFSVLLSYSWWRSSHPITTRINSSFVTLKDCTHTHFYMSSHVCFWVMHSHDACGFDLILSVLFMSWCFISFLKNLQDS